MFTPTPAGMADGGISLARTATGNSASESSNGNFIAAIVTRSVQFAIRGEALNTAFTAETAFLVAAEGAGGIELVVSVGPDDAGAQLVHHLENLAAFVGPNAGAKSVGNVVG